MLRVLAYASGGLVLLLVLVLLLLQTRWGATQAVQFTLEKLNLFEGATLQVDAASGSILRSLTLYNVTVREDSTDVVLVHTDTLHATYRLWPLLNRTVRLTDLYLATPDVAMAQRADSTWNLVHMLRTDTTAAPPAPPTQAPWTILAEQVRLREGNAMLSFLHPQDDSTYYLSDIQLHASDLRTGDTLAIRLDTLGFKAQLPQTSDTLTLSVAGSLSNRELTVEGLRLLSARSHVSGQGTLRLPADSTDTVNDVDFTLAIDTLAFQDIRMFAPSLDPEAAASANVTVTGSGRLLHAEADARFSDGGTLTLTADVTPTTVGDVTYQLEARLRDLNPRLFAFENPNLDGVLSTEVSADLSGPSLDALDGTVTLVAPDIVLGAYDLVPTRLSGTFTDGSVTIDARTGLRGETVRINGTARPFAETPTYDLTVGWTALNLADLLQDPTKPSDLNGRLRLTGSGFNRETLDATARLQLEPSSYSNAELTSGELVAEYENDAIRFTADVAIAGGTLFAEGTANVGDNIRYAIRQGRISDMRFTELLADTTAGRLNATFTMVGQGTDPQGLDIQANVQLADTQYGPYRIREANLEANLRDARATLASRATLVGGQLAFQATAQPFADPLTFAFTDFTFQHLDVGALQGQPTPTSDLNGQLRLGGRGSTPETLSLTAELDLGPSSYNAQPITDGTITASLRNQQATAQMQLETPDGAVNLQAQARPFAENPTYSITESTFSGLDLASILNAENMPSNLNGRLSLEGEGFDPSTSRLTATLDLDPSSLNTEAITDGNLRVTLDQGQTEAAGVIDFDDGRVQLRASGNLQRDIPTYDIDASFQNIRLAELLGIDTLGTRLSFDLDLQGSGFAPETMQAEGIIVANTSQVLDVAIDTLRADFHISNGTADVDTLLLRSNVADVTGSGRLALPDTLGDKTSDFVFEASIKELTPLQPFTNIETLRIQSGDLRARVFGPSTHLRFESMLNLNSLAFNELRAAELEGRLVGELDGNRALREAELRATVDFLSFPAFTAERTRLDLMYDSSLAVVAGEMIVDSRRNARFEATVDPQAENITLEGLQLNLDNDRWDLLQEATITYGDAYNIRNFLLFTDDQQIAVDGLIDPNGQQNLLFTIEQFRIDAVADLLGFDGLAGTLNGALSMDGHASDPEINGALVLGLQSRNRPVGDLNVSITYADLQLGLDARLEHVNDNALTMQGYLPLDLRISTDSTGSPDLKNEGFVDAGDLNFAIQAQDFDIGWIGPFLDPATISSIRGQLTTDVQISGTPSSPTFAGFARLSNGALTYPILGLTHRSVSGELDFADNQVLVKQLSLRSGSGTVRANGTVDFSDLTLGQFNITADATNFLAIDNAEYKASATGNVTLSGTTTSPELTGNLTVPSMDVYLTATEELDEVTLTEQDIQTVEQRFGIRVTEDDTTTFSFYQALAINNLRISLERDSWVRSKQSPRMDVQFTGNLNVRKDPYADPQAFGTIEVLTERSRIEQFGKTFKLREGTLTFNGPVNDPIMDFEAVYEVPSRGNSANEVTIILSLEGRLDDLDITFSSENPAGLPETDIISYIATGRPASQALQFGGSGLENIAFSQLSSIVEGVASAGLGLDVIEIRYEENRITVTAGTYLSPELYAAVSQPLARSSSNATNDLDRTQFTLEYEIITSLLFRLVNQGSNTTVNFIWEYAY